MYVKYLGSLQTLLSQKSEVERLLAKEGRSGSRSDSDGEVELFELEALTKVVNDNKRQWEELNSIMIAHGG